MKKFVIEDAFWETFPQAKIGIVVANDIDNGLKSDTQFQSLLENAEKEALKYFVENDFSSNRVIKVWREAFQRFKTKKGARSSIEALLKRVINGNHIGCINPLVDIYNSISLKYAMPCGGEDIATFRGDVKLTKALGGEHFITLGSDEDAPPYQGEIVYKDDEGAICRCWNWRESVRTMLTENTKDAFLCIELVDEERVEAFEAALIELSTLINENLGGKCQTFIMDINNREMVIEA